MFKKTNPQQNLFGVDAQLSPGLQKRLQASWAHLFKREILPILFASEEEFALLYGDTGRPNFSVARMLGLCLLQEIKTMSDQQALDAFGFDVRWRYALDVHDDQAYLSRRSLVEFRRRLVTQDPDMTRLRGLFERISKRAIKQLNVSTGQQRLDSTHIVSNIRTRSRLDLFASTLTVFIKSLERDRFDKLPKAIRKWYECKPEGWFGMPAEKRKAKLKQLAQYTYKIVHLFRKDELVMRSEPYQLLARLFQEQCDVQGQRKTIQLKKKTQGSTLASVFDPESSYGHKDTGYSVHITETCHNPDTPEIITDYDVHGASQSDKDQAWAIVDRLERVGIKPKKLFADGGYPSTRSVLAITERDIELMAPVHRGPLAKEVMGRNRFKFSKKGQVLKCPMGYKPVDHRILSQNNTTDRCLHAIFDGDTCRSCRLLDRCPVRAPNHRARGCQARDTAGHFRLEITPELRLRDQMYATQQTRAWKKKYRIRSGVEATMSELKRAHGVGKLRVRRVTKVRFAIACKVMACNIKRWARVFAVAFIGLKHLTEFIWRSLTRSDFNIYKKRHFSLAMELNNLSIPLP